jgi:hypothetical protein
LSGPNWQIAVLTPNLTEITNVSGAQNLVLNFTATNADFHTIRVRNVETNNPSQVVRVKATYTAPRNRLTPVPMIVRQPTNIFTIAGSNARFEVEATGNALYQWQREGTNIASATGNSFTVLNVTTNDSSSFSVQVWNEARIVPSATATLTVYADATPEVTVNAASANTFSFSVDGRNGLTYEIQKSTDLENWSAVETRVAPFQFSDAMSGGHAFYRLVYVP